MTIRGQHDGRLRLLVNGESCDYAGDPTVQGVLAMTGAAADQVAVMVNECIVKRADYGSARVADGDRVEILTFAGGG